MASGEIKGMGHPASTTPPDFNLNGKTIYWPQFGGETYMAWFVKSFCIRYPPNSHNPWLCSYGYATLLSVNIPTIPYACTYNP